jgi:hypothetical protein
MSWVIYVEGQRVDPPNDLSAEFTYTIDDLKDFAARNTAFSKTIVIPGTGRNKAVFGHIFELGSANWYDDTEPNVGYNYNAAKAAKCLITQDGIPVFKGVIRVLEIIIDKDRIEFETAVFGELGGLVVAVGDKKIQDLDFSAYNHTFSLANIVASWSSAIGSGYYYPLIDYGYTIDGIKYPVETFRPAFYLKEYIDKIFEEAGYTYESTFFAGDFFKSLLIPFNAIYPAFEVSTVLHATDVTHTVSNNTNFAGASPINFDTIVGTSYITANGTNTKFTWQRAEKVTTKLTFSCSWSRPSTFGSGVLGIGIGKNNAEETVHAENMGSNLSGSFSFSTVLDIDTNDVIEIRPYAPLSSGVTITSVVFKLEGQPTVMIPIGLGDSIEANNMLPKNVLQKDLLTWMVKLFNLYIDEDKDREKHLIITPYVDFWAGKGAPQNWDNKIDRSQPIRIKPMGELNARIYEFKYKDDSDYYNDTYKKKYGETYGTYVYDTGYEFIKDRQITEIGFSPSPLVQYKGSDRVITSIVKKTETSQERTASNIRLLSRKSANISCTEWYITNLGATIGTYTSYPYAGHLDDPDAPSYDLNFGVPAEFYFVIVTGYLSANMFNVFWSTYMSEITDKDSKVLSAEFKLTPLDIYTIDFGQTFIIGGQYWRLNKIEDYSTTQPSLTKCELLKVIDNG